MCKEKSGYRLFIVTGVIFVSVFVSMTAYAQPFGAGKFDANVPFGSQTSLSISTGGNVGISASPSDSGTLSTGSGVVTVTSTDVIGYKLYLRALSSTNLTNGGSNIPASGNLTPAALAVNTWGYNIDGSTNFTGITSSDALIKNATGPYSSGDATTFTYGVKIDNTEPAGSYVTSVVYTAVPQTN